MIIYLSPSLYSLWVPFTQFVKSQSVVIVRLSSEQIRQVTTLPQTSTSVSVVTLPWTQVQSPKWTIGYWQVQVLPE